jgi:hypothetical protein
MDPGFPGTRSSGYHGQGQPGGAPGPGSEVSSGGGHGRGTSMKKDTGRNARAPL